MRFYLAVLFAGLSSIYFAQTSKTNCFDCHSDKTLTMERGKVQVSLFVDQNSFRKSVHADIECTDCHTGFDADNVPHKGGKDIAKVDCGQCHDVQDFTKSIHGQKDIRCFDCHGRHEIKPSVAVHKAEADFCIKCHKSPAVVAYKQSIHFKKFLEGVKAPVCTDCHDKSAHKIKAAKFDKAGEEKLCSGCHKQSQTGFSESIHKIAVKDNNTPGCISCHGAHQIYNNKYSISSRSCLRCHLDQNKFLNEKSKLVDFVKNYQVSIHSKAGKNGKEAATCTDCHGNHVIMGMEVAGSTVSRNNIPGTCGRCHADILKNFNKSSHGLAFAKGVKVAPNCVDCHGEHTIVSIKDSQKGKLAEKDVCFNCHVKNPEVVKLTGHTSQEVLNYEKSAHFIALKNGNEKAPACSDCHSAHMMQSAQTAGSNINHSNIAASCGKNADCHQGIAAEYQESVHGKAVKNGKTDAPTCINCHGNHQIYDKGNPASSVSHGKQVVQLCSHCHGNVKLTSKYNLSASKFQSYSDSYHGLAIRGGSKFAADCSSCHGTHNIKPSSDTTSTINSRNLSKTCNKCHPGANIAAQFKKVHITGDREESPFLYWLSKTYIILIAIIIGGMFIHNLLDFLRKLQYKKRHREEIKELRQEDKVYLRMSLSERVQHFIMLTSFISLVITGFALKYPEAWWVLPARNLLGEFAFQTRSLLHRFFGISMGLVSLYHVYYLSFTKRGRRMFIDMLPNLQDAKDILINVKYLLGIRKEKPYFDRFSYMEKAEYWALLWGVIIMSFTGLMLMFNSYFLSSLPKILLDAATYVHLYEAWLATLAIIVWHFYFTILNPEVYPLNKSFIKGILTEEEMLHEHPKELDRIKGTDRKEDAGE
ncbi:MAG: cytochrome b/b6 domain-containing protein [Ignavibacteria bacterium]